VTNVTGGSELITGGRKQFGKTAIQAELYLRPWFLILGWFPKEKSNVVTPRVYAYSPNRPLNESHVTRHEIHAIQGHFQPIF